MNAFLNAAVRGTVQKKDTYSSNWPNPNVRKLRVCWRRLH